MVSALVSALVCPDHPRHLKGIKTKISKPINEAIGPDHPRHLKGIKTELAQDVDEALGVRTTPDT